MIEDIFNRYDKNKSGVLEREESRDRHRSLGGR